MIDTHCHLTDPRLNDQLADVLRRAAEAGVDRLVSIGTGIDDSRATARLAAGHDDVHAVVGVHPAYSHQNPADPTPELREIAAMPKVVALGEMGLDYHWDDAPRARQRESFGHQLGLAAELDLPVVIHSREAIPDTLALMADHRPVRGGLPLLHRQAGERRADRRGRPPRRLHRPADVQEVVRHPLGRPPRPGRPAAGGDGRAVPRAGAGAEAQGLRAGLRPPHGGEAGGGPGG